MRPPQLFGIGSVNPVFKNILNVPFVFSHKILWADCIPVAVLNSVVSYVKQHQFNSQASETEGVGDDSGRDDTQVSSFRSLMVNGI